MRRDTVNMRTLLWKIFIWEGSLAVSEVQFIIIMAKSLVVYWQRRWSRNSQEYIACRKQELDQLSEGSLIKIGPKACPPKDPLSPKRSQLLIVSLLLGGVIFFWTMTVDKSYEWCPYSICKYFTKFLSMSIIDIDL